MPRNPAAYRVVLSHLEHKYAHTGQSSLTDVVSQAIEQKLRRPLRELLARMSEETETPRGHDLLKYVSSMFGTGLYGEVPLGPQTPADGMRVGLGNLGAASPSDITAMAQWKRSANALVINPLVILAHVIHDITTNRSHVDGGSLQEAQKRLEGLVRMVVAHELQHREQSASGPGGVQDPLEIEALAKEAMEGLSWASKHGYKDYVPPAIEHYLAEGGDATKMVSALIQLGVPQDQAEHLLGSN
jgi:hypothetical protein